jgi:hypothetical protein
MIEEIADGLQGDAVSQVEPPAPLDLGDGDGQDAAGAGTRPDEPVERPQGVTNSLGVAAQLSAPGGCYSEQEAAQWLVDSHRSYFVSTDHALAILREHRAA